MAGRKRTAPNRLTFRRRGNPAALSLSAPIHRQRIVRPKKGKGSYTRKKDTLH